VNSTFGRCCHCPCCKEEEKENIEQAGTFLPKDGAGNIYNTNNTTNNIIKNFYEEFNDNNNNEETSEDESEPYYYQIINDSGNCAKDCFYRHWYKVRSDSVIRLKRIKEKKDNAWEVTGNGNMWTITGNNDSGLNKKNYNPENKTWIIFKITTWDSRTEKPGNSYIFYVDDISLWKGGLEFDGNILKDLSAFKGVKCYTWTLLHANTANVTNFSDLFCHFSSVLEKDKKTNRSGLKGLEKLNMTKALIISKMFFCAIYKQDTLSQLSKWKLAHGYIDITELFHSSSSEELDFHALDGWATNCMNEDTKFLIFRAITDAKKKETFFSFPNPDVNKLPNWYAKIG
jgi:hypothetical protein